MSVFIEMLTYRKGDGCDYRPAPGTVCEISAPHCDNENGYVFARGEVLWTDATFIVWRTKGCWPTVNKWEHIRSRPLPEPPTPKFLSAYPDSFAA
jgi:hypothetical protein